MIAQLHKQIHNKLHKSDVTKSENSINITIQFLHWLSSIPMQTQIYNKKIMIRYLDKCTKLPTFYRLHISTIKLNVTIIQFQSTDTVIQYQRCTMKQICVQWNSYTDVFSSTNSDPQLDMKHRFTDMKVSMIFQIQNSNKQI